MESLAAKHFLNDFESLIFRCTYSCTSIRVEFTLTFNFYKHARAALNESVKYIYVWSALDIEL